MRTLVAMFVGAAFLMGAAAPLAAGENYTPIPVALSQQQAPSGSVWNKLRKSAPQIAFCGQCSRNSDCGTCRCTGPSDGSCNKCVCP